MDGSSKFLTTKYNRWKPEEREHLFPTLYFSCSDQDKKLSSIPKLGGKLSKQVLQKIRGCKTSFFLARGAEPSFYVHRIPYNYIKAFNFVPYFWNEVDGVKKSEDYKPYFLASKEEASTLLAVLNSNLFFWWWYTFFEGYHCGKHEIHSFPSGFSMMKPAIKQALQTLADTLMADYRKNAVRKEAQYKTTGKVIYDEFYPRYSKPIIDEIDRVLARHYGFTDEELDFIINYDIKYRMGRDAEEG
jgi:hypothetical protein